MSRTNLTTWMIALALGAIPAAVIVLTPTRRHYPLAADLIADIGTWLAIAGLFRLTIYLVERSFNKAGGL